jgi:hypothetical protein
MGGVSKRAALRQAVPLSLGLLFAPLPAVAFGSYCSAPSEPHCVSGASGFEDAQSASSCRFKLEAYLSAVERQANCLLLVAEEEARQRVEEGRREADKARAEGRRALARFECKSRGGSC